MPLKHDRSLPAAAAVLVSLALIGGWQLFHPAPAALTQWDIDNAVKYTLGNTPPGPAKTTVAAATIAPSVVRVDGYLSPEHAAAGSQGGSRRGAEEPSQAHAGASAADHAEDPGRQGHPSPIPPAAAW